MCGFFASYNDNYLLDVFRRLKAELYAPYGEDGKEAMQVSEAQVGTLFAPVGRWASCIRIFNPFLLKTEKIIEMAPNEHPLSVQIMNFKVVGRL